MKWLGRLVGGGRGGLCTYSCKEGKLLEPCGLGRGRDGSSATVAAAAAASTLVEEGRDGQVFLAILDTALEMGTGVGLLAWLRSWGSVRVREAVGTCIGGGRGRAFGMLWDFTSISESESSSSPHNACGMFDSAAHCPIWAGRTGVGDHVSGFEPMGSGELPRSCELPDILARFLGTQVFSQLVSWSKATMISIWR